MCRTGDPTTDGSNRDAGRLGPSGGLGVLSRPFDHSKESRVTMVECSPVGPEGPKVRHLAVREARLRISLRLVDL